MERDWHSGATRLAFLLTGLAILLHRTRGAKAGWLLPLLIGADIVTHAPRQNPTAPMQAYDAFTQTMSSIPHLDDPGPGSARMWGLWLDHLANPSPLGLYLGQRTDLADDCNLLEPMIPKVDGFFPASLERETRVLEALGQPGRSPRLEEFLGVSQITYQ